MGVFDQELILPGVITDIISDYSSGYDTSKFGTTDSVTIIGTAFDGPVGRPIPIYSPEHAKYVFGPTFDFNTKRETTLVAEIIDAWDRGCRTIYGVRVSGKEIYKDFQLATDIDCKLRVSGIFPSNQNKSVFFEYIPEEDMRSNGAATIKIYKPASRATIEEKMMGRVSKEDSILVNMVKTDTDWNVSKTTRLIDFMRLFNRYKYNNVLKLSLINEDGEDVSETPLGQSITFGDMLPGIYFIGRDSLGAGVIAETSLIYNLVPDSEKSKIYDKFSEDIYKVLEYNTDINKNLPIYDTSKANLGRLLGNAVAMVTPFDFLEITGAVDKIWLQDKNDYEEVVLDNFEMYKRLGSGFANTCKIVETNTGAKTYRVQEVTDDLDENRIKSLYDGIYSMLENLKSDYRVLTGKYADVEIRELLPKKDRFLVTDPKTNAAFVNATSQPVINVTAKISKTDLKTAPITYTFEMHKIEDDSELFSKDKIISNLYKADVSDKLYEAYQLTDALATSFVASDKNYLLLNMDGNCVVYGKNATEPKGIEPLALLKEVLTDGEAQLFTTVAKDLTTSSTKTRVTLRASNLDSLTLVELLNLMLENEQLSKLFTFELASISQDGYKPVSTVIKFTDDSTDKTTCVDRNAAKYDTNLYIPFKTSDNFLRQLAQHCIYTGLKTAPTHGVIGCSKLMTSNLEAIANKVDKLAKADYKLYAKKPNGNNMLDKNNTPYDIGRAVSCTFFQHAVETGDNYTYLSSGAAAYAGMVSALPINQSSTAQSINISTTEFELTNYQLARLTQSGYVTVKNSYTKGYVVTDGVTMAPVTSAFRRLSVTRIINGIDEAIRAVAEPFIGKQNHVANRNSLQTAIKSTLDKMLENLIEKYDFRLVVDKAAQRMGIIEIEYTIIPVYEIKEIRNRVSVKDSQ